MNSSMLQDDSTRGLLRQVATEHGTPCFVYFMDHVAQRISDLRSAFGGRFEVSYAMKCNPNPAILNWMESRVDTIDVSSRGELIAALRAGWDAARISFTGPAKTDRDLQEAAASRIGEVVLESVREARLLNACAQKLGIIQPVLLRVAPKHVPHGFGVNMSGKPTQFGIDEEDLSSAMQEVSQLAHLRVTGFHAYSATQCLKAEAIGENWNSFARIFASNCERFDIVPTKLIFGSGIGVPYFAGDAAVDLNDVAAVVCPQIDALRREPRFAATRLMLETGRFLVGEAGLYLTSAVHAKSSRGTDIVVFDGGMNHHLGAAGHLGMVIHRPYRMFKISDEVRTPAAAAVERPYDLYGPLCTTIDTLGRKVMFPGLAVGDVIAVHCSGAYGATSSPVHFISHDPPGEVMVTRNAGTWSVTDCSSFKNPSNQLPAAGFAARVLS